jgi:hypothetical protein
MQLITALDRIPESPARTAPPTREPLRLGAVQHQNLVDPGAAHA